MALSKDPELLRAIIMQHYDQPTNKVDDPSSLVDYINYHNKSSSCIDDIDLYLKIENNIIIDARFYGVGCAISTASTDIFCDILKNKDIEFAKKLMLNYFSMIKNEEYDENILDELIAFCNIYQQANRRNCATIGINALEKIIKEINEK